MTPSRFAAALAAVLMALAGSGCDATRHGGAAAATGDTAIAALGTLPRTTDGTLAQRNLDVQVRALEQALPAAGSEARQQLVALLGARAQYTGSVADRTRALQLAEALVAAAPDDPRALLSRAGARAGLHGFRAALQDVDRAAALGAPADAVAPARAGLLQSLGRYDEALAIRRAAVARERTTDTLAALGTLLAERGEHPAAAAAFAAARAAYRDVSPFPLAWILFEEGLMWMRAGDPARAHPFFAAAHERLPGYVAAACHLAEVDAALGGSARAIERLGTLAAASDDPDPAAQLARILDEAGDAQAAARWRAQAAGRYDQLLAGYRDAFADHAAEFFLAAGADPARALALAHHNLRVRPTAGAYALLLDAAEAAGSRDTACGVARGAESMGAAPAMQAVGVRARALCG